MIRRLVVFVFVFLVLGIAIEKHAYAMGDTRNSNSLSQFESPENGMCDEDACPFDTSQSCSGVVESVCSEGSFSIADRVTPAEGLTKKWLISTILASDKLGSAVDIPPPRF